MNPPLSAAALSVWGKSDRQGTSAIGWLPLWRHMADTSAVAERLWDHWLSPAVAARVSASMPGGPPDARALLSWLAGVHDSGKATPAFACQAPGLAGRMREHGLGYCPEPVHKNRRHAPHATAGHLVLSEWLRTEHGWESGEDYAIVVGGHHGAPPSDSALDNLSRCRHLLLGDSAWQAVQHELLAWMAQRTGAADRLAEWAVVRLSQPLQACLTGLVIVADWIASKEEYFPYDLTAVELSRIEHAWCKVDLPAPWTPGNERITLDEHFAARFNLPAGATPRPVQRKVAELAESMPLPGMMIVEAAMGEGKTEAALAAVETFARRSGASGCFIALPTRATSDAMFSRVLEWLRRLPDADIGRGPRDVMLAHGKSAFNEQFDRLRWQSLPSEIGVDEGGADIGVNQWLAGRKRALLNSFVIGTVDQLLLSSLRAKHLMLRHLGLAGKVVVIDEAHAYDVYMNSFLDRALEWLGAHGAPVIVLSATLPAERRAKLMKAYDDGRCGRVPVRTWRDRHIPEVDLYAELRTDLRYPLITTSADHRGATTHASAESGRGIEVSLRHLDDEPATLSNLLRTRLADGGCALVVRNTVARVQQTAEDLRLSLGPDYPIRVAHSRFMAHDRAANDEWLRTTFGPPGMGTRPERHIVVASQVAEQSLDIDFDLLITDLAPIDLMLQRIGRLHRHSRPQRPAHLAEATCYITGADWTSTPPTPVIGSRRVYHESALLRAAAVINGHLNEQQPLRLPADIAPLTQAAYATAPVGPGVWHPAIEVADAKAADRNAEKENKARNFLLDNVGSPGQPLVGWLTGGVGAADERTARGHVRDSDAESLEVILLVRNEDGLVIPPWIVGGGQPVPTDAVPPPRLARLIASCTLPLPRLMTAPDVIDDVIAELEGRAFFPAWSESPWLAGELALELDGDRVARLGIFDLKYDVDNGLLVSKSGV